MHFKNKKPFVPHNERLEIVAALKYVDEAVTVTFENIDRIDAGNSTIMTAFSQETITPMIHTGDGQSKIERTGI
jgi:glycerol-3-phosphate cytidylyltransferase